MAEVSLHRLPRIAEPRGRRGPRTRATLKRVASPIVALVSGWLLTLSAAPADGAVLNPASGRQVVVAPSIAVSAAHKVYGACIVRDSYTSMPAYGAPVSGKGYAMHKLGEFDDFGAVLDTVRAQCTDAIFRELTKLYCVGNSNPTQWGIATFDSSGHAKTTACAASGCAFHKCPERVSAACIVRDSYTSMPAYGAPVSGKGYAMHKLGEFDDFGAVLDTVRAQCTDAIFRELTKLYCAGNSNPTQWGIATFDSSGHPKTSACAASGCAFHKCPERVTAACIMRDSSTSMPTYGAPVSGKGYAMHKLGEFDDFGAVLDTVRARCTDTIFRELTKLYCVGNSNPTQWGIATFDSSGHAKTTACAASGCAFHKCPERVSAACIVRDSYTSMPAYGAPDSAKGYAMHKLGEFDDFGAVLDTVRARCTDAIFRELTKLYCAGNSNPTQWGIATFDSSGHAKTTACAASGCAFHNCPPAVPWVRQR